MRRNRTKKMSGTSTDLLLLRRRETVEVPRTFQAGKGAGRYWKPQKADRGARGKKLRSGYLKWGGKRNCAE